MNGEYVDQNIDEYAFYCNLAGALIKAAATNTMAAVRRRYEADAKM